jgi:hypothetical protein
MGYGNYSHAAHEALLASRSAKADHEVFIQRGCHTLMNPKGLKARESRDSDAHPNSVAIIFALDVTGSMGAIPTELARTELPVFMKVLTDCNVADPQIMFMAVGDVASDRAPLQVGQFESSAELMDQWLTWSFLEGGGGGNKSESYELAIYTATQHTDIDCWNKRKKKGYLFLTGDELPYPVVSRQHVDAILGDTLDVDVPIEEVISACSESFHIFFLIPDQARRRNCEARWRELLGDQVICMESHHDTCAVAASLVALTEKSVPNIDALADKLKAHGFDAKRTGATVRAVRSYAELMDSSTLNPGAIHRGTSSAVRPSWWKKLFG